jgi:hypothetical protein
MGEGEGQEESSRALSATKANKQIPEAAQQLRSATSATQNFCRTNDHTRFAVRFFFAQ